MSFYKSPIQPFDPIVKEDQATMMFRYIRDSFEGSGQDSHTVPPAQNQEMWQQLINVMPVTKNNLERRWGYSSFTSTLNANANRLFILQRDSDLLRTIISTGGIPEAFLENGTTYNYGIFQPFNTINPLREVTSRSYAYFLNNVLNDTKKWDGSAANITNVSLTTNVVTITAAQNFVVGQQVFLAGLTTATYLNNQTITVSTATTSQFTFSFTHANDASHADTGTASGGVTKWGIDVNNVAGSATAGPNAPTSASDLGGGHAWSNPTNIEVEDGSVASVSLTGSTISNVLQGKTFAFATTGTVLGIQADVKADTNATAISQNFRPSSYVNAGHPYANPQYGNDAAGDATNSTANSSLGVTFQETWQGFGAASGTVSSATLQIDTAASNISNGAFAKLEYSVDNGANYTQVYNTLAPRAFTQDMIVLSPLQDLTQVKVRASIGGGNSPFIGTHHIYDIVIHVNTTASPTNIALLAQLVNNGVAVGQVKTLPVTTTSLAFYTYGGSSDTWGASWLSSDINNANFGINLRLQNSNASGTFTGNVDFVKITIYLSVTSGSGPVVSSTSSGAVNLTVGRVYYVTFKNSITGHYSDLTPPSLSTGPLVNKQVNLTLPVSQDPQVDRKAILGTADGGDPSVLYQVAERPNSDTTYTDNTVEGTLVLNQQLLFTDQFGNDFGVAANSPPPLGNVAVKHQGRLWIASGENVFFSKDVAELTLPNGFIAGKYEEAWPGSNYFDISEGAETVSGLLSDGSTLYIGTQSHIRRLLGNDPSNFQAPQVVHPQTGLINQEVWQVVYTQGSPSGCIWMTPDFRVIRSDFNTYIDIGKPIQDILNNIQSTASSLAHADFVLDGEFELYILSVPVNSPNYCDTHLVYDMKHQVWFVWNTANGSLASLFNITSAGIPQWLFISGNSTNIFLYDQTLSQDNGTAIPVTATTSWLHLGEPTRRKVLQELEVIGDSGMLASVFGASTQADFSAPNLLKQNVALKTSPFGQFKVYLNSVAAKDRYYQLSFFSNDGTQNFLDSYNLQAIPWNAL